MLMLQILQGILGMALGLLILIFRPKIKDFTGDIAFAERYFGSGGTWTFLVILGIGLFLFSLMWATGSMQDFLSEKIGFFF